MIGEGENGEYETLELIYIHYAPKHDLPTYLSLIYAGILNRIWSPKTFTTKLL